MRVRPGSCWSFGGSEPHRFPRAKPFAISRAPSTATPVESSARTRSTRALRAYRPTPLRPAARPLWSARASPRRFQPAQPIGSLLDSTHTHRQPHQSKAPRGRGALQSAARSKPPCTPANGVAVLECACVPAPLSTSSAIPKRSRSPHAASCHTSRTVRHRSRSGATRDAAHVQSDARLTPNGRAFGWKLIVWGESEG